MALHPLLPRSPCAVMDPAWRWFPADGGTAPFRWYYAQREAVESVIWLYDVRGARDKFDLMRFDAPGAVSAGMFPEDWPRYVVKMATGAGKTKAREIRSASTATRRPASPNC